MEALTIPVTVYVMATTNPYLPTSYHSFTCDMSQQYPDLYVLVTTKTVEVPILMPGAINAESLAR